LAESLADALADVMADTERGWRLDEVFERPVTLSPHLDAAAHGFRLHAGVWLVAPKRGACRSTVGMLSWSNYRQPVKLTPSSTTEHAMQTSTPETPIQPRTLTPEELAVLVRMLREAKSWSQEQLADIAKLSTRTVQRVEEGQPSSLDTRRALAGAMGFEDVDAFNKPHVIPTAEQVAEQKARFEKEHMTLKGRRIEKGKQLGRLVEQCSAHLFHEAADLPAPAAEVFARLTDFSREYGDCDELYSAVDKLGVYEDLSEMIDELHGLGFTLVAATRDTQLLTSEAVKGVPVSIIYVVVFPRGEESEQLVVAKKVKFGW
jgi:transcriptional regulator with XRE-family HTH domain